MVATRAVTLTRRPAQSLATALTAALCLSVTAWAWQRPTHSLDDAYITYRYAHNLASGHGLVYNPGERVLGTTTPLYAVLLALGAFVWPDLPALSLFYGGLGWAAAVGLLYATGRRATSPAAGVVAAGLLAFDPLINAVLGMETHVYVAVILLAFYLQMAGRPRLAALAAGAAFLLRWDGILVGGAILLAESTRTRRAPWRAAAVVLAVIVPWLVFSQLYFGSIFPNTFFAKTGQSLTGLQGGGANPFAVEGLRLIADRISSHWAGALYVPLFALGVLKAWRQSIHTVAANQTKLWPLLLWTAGYIAGYAALGVIGFGWYYVPILPGVALAIAVGAETVTELLGRWLPAPWQRAARLLPVGLALLLWWPQARALPWGSGSQPGQGRVASYRMASDWLNANTARDSSVAMLEIGVVGYTSNRYIVDMMGLVTPTMLGHLSGWAQVNYYGVARHWPDYVLTLNSMALNRPTPTEWFRRVYLLAATLENPIDRDAPLRIYQRRHDFPPAEYAVQWPQALVFDQQFALDHLDATTAQITPGTDWPVRLSWHVDAKVTSDYRFDFELVNLRDGQHRLLDSGARPFYGGSPTTQWRAGEVYDEQRLLLIPPDLPPGDYRLLVRAFQDTTEAVPARAATGERTPAISGRLNTVASPPALPAFTEAPVEFAGGIRLDGYRRDGDSLVLYWDTDSSPKNARTAFIHVSTAKALLSRRDSTPVAAEFPTSLWEPGVTIVDIHPLVPPAEGARFCVSLCDSLTLARLPIVSATGYEVDHDVACQDCPGP